MESNAAEPSSAEVTASYKPEARSSVRPLLVSPRKQPNEATQMGSADIAAFIRKLGASSVTDLDNAIAELQQARDHVNSESERLQREAARYGLLSETASASAKAISETLGEWRKTNSPVRT